MNAYYIYYTTPAHDAKRATFLSTEYLYTAVEVEQLAKEQHALDALAVVAGVTFFYEIENKTLPTLELENNEQQ
jgi:hypothetical protein